MLNFNVVGRTSLFLTIEIRRSSCAGLLLLRSLCWLGSRWLSLRIWNYIVRRNDRCCCWWSPAGRQGIWCIFIIFVQGNTFDFQTQISWARQINGLATISQSSSWFPLNFTRSTSGCVRSFVTPSWFCANHRHLQLMRSRISNSHSSRSSTTATSIVGHAMCTDK